MHANRRTQILNMLATNQLELNLSDTGNEKGQFCIHIKKACCLYRVGLDSFVRDGSVISFFSGDTLYVDADDSFVSKNKMVADADKAIDDLFAGD